MGKHFLGNFEIYCIPSKSQSTMSGLTKRCMCVCEREREVVAAGLELQLKARMHSGALPGVYFHLR